MSYKFDSLITILNKLDSGAKVTVQSLVDWLEISERTVYRYIQTLQTAGFPIIFDRRKDSYVFTDGYTLQRPHFSLEETLAFALAKKLLKNFGTGMEKSLNTIEAKLLSKKADLPRHIILSAETPLTEKEKYLGTIHQAITNFQRIHIVYCSLYSDEETTVRNVDPYYLFFQENFWHLRAYCRLRKDFRTFALDRIVSLEILDEHFLPKNISPESELSGTFASFVDGEPVEVVLRFDKEIRPHVLRKKWHQSQKVKELKNGRLEVRFHVNGLEGIRQWIYRWVPYVEVVAPEELRSMVQDELKKMLQRQNA